MVYKLLILFCNIMYAFLKSAGVSQKIVWIIIQSERKKTGMYM